VRHPLAAHADVQLVNAILLAVEPHCMFGIHMDSRDRLATTTGVPPVGEIR
jgi:hypothetical protein